MVNGTDVRLLTVADIQPASVTMGHPNDPPVLLVAGLGGQLISWDEAFCRLLVDQGLYVVRFDNRDAGLSTHLDDRPPGTAPAYALSDLAADTAGLIAHLGLDSVHVVGVSMGGMIAQLLAIEFPDRVRSLTSIMSTTGDPGVGEATDEAIAILLAPPVSTRDAVLDRGVQSHRVLGSPGYPTDEDVLRARVGRAFDRAFDPAGVARQLQAAMTTPDRTEALGGLDIPTLVIHGADDALIGVSGGRATAAAVPDAELVVIEGMGHDLPQALWPTVTDRIADLVRRAEP